MIYAYAFDNKYFELGCNFLSWDVHERRFYGACGLLFACQQTHSEVFDFLFKHRIFDVRLFWLTIERLFVQLGGRVCGSITVMHIFDFQLCEDRDMAAFILSRFSNLTRLHVMVSGHANDYTKAVVDALRKGEVEVLCEWLVV